MFVAFLVPVKLVGALPPVLTKVSQVPGQLQMQKNHSSGTVPVGRAHLPSQKVARSTALLRPCITACCRHLPCSAVTRLCTVRYFGTEASFVVNFETFQMAPLAISHRAPLKINHFSDTTLWFSLVTHFFPPKFRGIPEHFAIS